MNCLYVCKMKLRFVKTNVCRIYLYRCVHISICISIYGYMDIDILHTYTCLLHMHLHTLIYMWNICRMYILVFGFSGNDAKIKSLC